MASFDGHIHFFDIKSSLPGVYQSWSPNTLKVRMALNYKRIPYVESFISYPDIKGIIDTYGIAYDTGFTTGPRATLPAIVHYDATGKVVKAIGNSAEIVRYLDTVSPELPVLSSPHLRDLGWENTIDAYVSAFNASFANARKASLRIIMPTVPGMLDDRGAKYFIDDRSTWDEYNRTSPLLWGSKDPEEDWNAFLPLLRQCLKTVDHLTDDRPYLLGSKPCFADFVLAGWLTWMRRGKEENFQRLVSETGGQKGVLGKFWKNTVQWIEAQGEVVEWKLESQ